MYKVRDGWVGLNQIISVSGRKRWESLADLASASANCLQAIALTELASTYQKATRYHLFSARLYFVCCRPKFAAELRCPSGLVWFCYTLSRIEPKQSEREEARDWSLERRCDLLLGYPFSLSSSLHLTLSFQQRVQRLPRAWADFNGQRL